MYEEIYMVIMVIHFVLAMIVGTFVGQKDDDSGFWIMFIFGFCCVLWPIWDMMTIILLLDNKKH
jgi:hypothetical protein